MTTAMTAPPKTYQEWLDCFAHMKEYRISEEYIEILSKGSIHSNPQMANRFQTHIVNLINDMLDARTRRFIKELDQLMEFNDIGDVVLLFKKFNKEIKQCLFFSRLDCVTAGFKKELATSVEGQTIEFLRKVMNHLSVQAFETNNFEMEDALYQIRKIKFFEH